MGENGGDPWYHVVIGWFMILIFGGAGLYFLLKKLAELGAENWIFAVFKFALAAAILWGLLFFMWSLLKGFLGIGKGKHKDKSKGDPHYPSEDEGWDR